jgi:hypothetical protein
MTKDEILAMEAGKEMDALIAEKVMGWHLVKRENYRDEWVNADGRYQHPVPRYDGYEDDEDFHTICWHPSESILWAWDVVEKLCLSVVPYPGGDKWHAADGKVIAFADTAPLAICRAALLVVMEQTNG